MAEDLEKTLSKLKKEIMNFLIGNEEDRVLSKEEVLYELDKPLIKIKEDLQVKISNNPPSELDGELSLSPNDLKEFLTILSWFNVPEEKWCIINPEPDIYYFKYDTKDELIKEALSAFFDLFSAKYARMMVKQKVFFSDKKQWKWSEVLALFEKDIKK